MIYAVWKKCQSLKHPPNKLIFCSSSLTHTSLNYTKSTRMKTTSFSLQSTFIFNLAFVKGESFSTTLRGKVDYLNMRLKKYFYKWFLRWSAVIKETSHIGIWSQRTFCSLKMCSRKNNCLISSWLTSIWLSNGKAKWMRRCARRKEIEILSSSKSNDNENF